MLRGLWLLRHPEVVRDLGERRLAAKRINALRSRFPSARIARDVVLSEYEPERLSLGEGVSIGSGCVLAFGNDAGGRGSVTIGPRTWLGEYNNLRAGGGGDIAIGADCLISQFCTLVGSNHAVARDRVIRDQGADPSRLHVTLGDDVWLGAGCVVAAGVTIGTGAVIGAGSVVTRSVPEYEIWAGVPARKIGERGA